MKIKDILLGGLVLFSACLQSCQDDELISVSEVPQTITRSTTDAASGLTKNAEGYWVASRRVPLVGEGRMVNDYSNALITETIGMTMMTAMVKDMVVAEVAVIAISITL